MECKDVSFECELCHKMFTQKSSRNRHVREQHLQPGLYQCKECGLRFSKKYNLQHHLEHLHIRNVKKNTKQFKCSFCKDIFKNMNLLKIHIKEQHENESSKTKDCTIPALDNESETDAKALAETVLKELKQLQKDIEISTLPENKQESTAIETALVKDKTIKDNLYPLGHFKLLKVQTIKRVNGVTYFICEFCSKEFKKTYNYLRHRRIHTKIKPFICVLCKKAFATKARLKTHCWSHKLNESLGVFHNLYKCPQCKESFSSLQQLDRHLRQTLSCSNVTFQCPECLKTYKHLKTLLNHKHVQNDKELEILKEILPKPLKAENQKDYVCNICGLRIKDQILLKQHEERHQNLYQNQCLECQQCFASKTALKIHTRTHATNEQYKCNYCFKLFKTETNCRRHMLRHLKTLIKTSEDEVEEDNNSLLTYPTFIENEETGQMENTEICIIKNFKKGKTQLTLLSQNKIEQKYKCLECNKTFQFKAWLKKHFNYKHTSLRSFKCAICLKLFRSKQTLEEHQRVHEKVREHVICRVCGREYSCAKSLKIHLRLHTQEKPFKCAKCEKTFRTSGHLKQHNKSNH
ncbi:uncharacterized protein ACRADG_004981 [Cochliomyia hominivorax]